MRALVIDDSRAVRKIVSEMLTELGFEVSEAVDGLEGLERAREKTPDVILVDWNMPRMTGLEFVQAARADSGLAGTPMLMVTTETDAEHVTTALLAGADEYVMKPFSAEVIREKLALANVLP